MGSVEVENLSLFEHVQWVDRLQYYHYGTCRGMHRRGDGRCNLPVVKGRSLPSRTPRGHAIKHMLYKILPPPFYAYVILEWPLTCRELEITSIVSPWEMICKNAGHFLFYQKHNYVFSYFLFIVNNCIYNYENNQSTLAPRLCFYRIKKMKRISIYLLNKCGFCNNIITDVQHIFCELLDF